MHQIWGQNLEFVNGLKTGINGEYMKCGNVSEQNFNGNLYILNTLSKKPAQCILKEQSNLIKLIKKENFDLFIKQDYVKNQVNIIATTIDEPYINVSNGVLITAKPSQYLDTARKTIENYKPVRQEYCHREYQKNKTFKDKFFDFVNDVLCELIRGVNNAGRTYQL